MKKLLFIPIVLFLVTACNQGSNVKANRKNDSLVSVITERDSSLSSFITSFNQIESNLDSVAAKQQLIAMNTNKFHGELKGNKKEHINAEIAAINDLMVKNHKEMEDLKSKLKGSKHSNALLEKTIKSLMIQISQKDYDLCELNLVLNSLNVKVAKLITTVDSLTEQNYIKSIVIDYQTSDLNAGYYIIGESKQLRDEKIIDKKGGLLGMGRTTELKDGFDNSMFTRIDISKNKAISVNGDDIKIITNHPSDSYTLDKDVTKKDRTKNLIITNPSKFWSTSKYLVIVKK